MIYFFSDLNIYISVRIELSLKLQELIIPSLYTQLKVNILIKTMEQYIFDDPLVNLSLIPFGEDSQTEENQFFSSPLISNQNDACIRVQATLSSRLSLKDIITNHKSKSNKLKPDGKLRRKISRTTKKRISNYKKNICGYITKKVLREYISGSYQHMIQDWCHSQNVDYLQTKNIYSSKIEGITGPSHIPSLFSSKKKEEIPIIRVFVKFFKWFLQERYVRHLFLEGKMQMKSAYIEYKNTVLLPMIMTIQNGLMPEQETTSTLQIHSSQYDVLI